MSDNSVNSKRIVRNTIYMYIRMFFTMLISLFTVRVIVNTLGYEDYGIYGAIGGAVMTLSVVTSVLANSSQRFFAVEIGKNDSTQLSNVFSITCLIFFCIAFLLFILAETFGLWFLQEKMNIPESRVDCVYWVYQFAVISFLISLVANPFQAMIIAKENMSVYAYLGVFDVVLKLGIVYVLCYFSVDKLKLYSFLVLVATLIIQTFYIIYALGHYKETRLKFVWDSKMVKSIFVYCTWTLFGSASYVANTQGVNVLLNIFFGPLANAAYVIANQIKNTVVSFGSNFFVAVRPAIIKSFAISDFNYTKNLFYFSTKILFSLLFIIMLPLIVEADYVLNLWLGDVSLYMVPFVRAMLVYSLILCLSDPITAIIQAAGAVKKYHIIVDGFTLLSLPVAYVFIRYFDCPPISVFYISIIIFVIAHYLRLVILHSITGFKKMEYLHIIVLPVVETILASTLPVVWLYNNLDQNFLSFLSICFISVTLVFISIILFVLNRNEKEMVKNIIKKKLRHE